MHPHETCRTVPGNKLSQSYVWTSDGTPDGVNVTLGWCDLVPALAEAGDADLALRPTAETGYEMPVKMGMASLRHNPFAVIGTCRRYPH
jgi:hypothetical protein